ncbi:hypothetical protein ACFU1R_24800 [Priestia megaterium]|uniref:hypothetical protein n=1 Tax=Priestia megaterium TaxID=1404 RepID=UPI0036712C7B
MKKLLVSIVLVFTLSAVTSYFVADPTVSIVEAKEKKKKSFALTWKGFKKRWKKEANSYQGLGKLGKIKNEAVDQTNMGPTKIGKIKDNIYVGMNTNRDADGDFGFVSVSGRLMYGDSKKAIKNNDNVRLALGLAILTADPNLSHKKRESIMNDKLKIFKTLEDREKRTYSYKGITYEVSYKDKVGGGPLTLKIIEE